MKYPLWKSKCSLQLANFDSEYRDVSPKHRLPSNGQQVVLSQNAANTLHNDHCEKLKSFEYFTFRRGLPFSQRSAIISHKDTRQKYKIFCWNLKGKIPFWVLSRRRGDNIKTHKHIYKNTQSGLDTTGTWKCLVFGLERPKCRPSRPTIPGKLLYHSLTISSICSRRTLLHGVAYTCFYIQVGKFKGCKVSLHHTGFTLSKYGSRNTVDFHGVRGNQLKSLTIRRRTSKMAYGLPRQPV